MTPKRWAPDRGNSRVKIWSTQYRGLPIRKISPTDVVLSSYASKSFVNRSTRSRFNYGKWIGEMLIAEATNNETVVFQNANIATVARYDVPLPWMYTTIAHNLSSFDVKNVKYVFDYDHRIELLSLTKEELKLERKGSVVIARTNGGLVLMYADDELIFIKDNIEEPYGTIDALLGFESSKVPLPMVELKIYSKMIPMGVVLGYLIGLSQLLTLLRTPVRRALPGDRLNLETFEYAIRFKNETLILDSRDRRATLIMSGWLHIHASIKQYDIGLFDKTDVYSPVMEREGIQSRYLRELDAMNTGFVDPITEELLRNMGEPIEYVPLLIRAVELLVDEYVPTRRDDAKGVIELTERIRGYERIPGTVYETLYKAMRMYSTKAVRSDAKIVVNPQDVINTIISDPTVSPINNINPIHALREREVVTFGGKGGRSKRAMVAKTRLYTTEDKGFISEASVDSGDVGVITYLSPNANLTSVRGTVRLYDEKRDGRSMLFSTSVQLAPAADGDVPKRVGFISVQLGHQIATASSDVQSFRTGAERTTIARMGKDFGQVAKDVGVVKELTDKRIVVEYKDGTEERFRIGDVEVSAEGTYYPHTLVTGLKVGAKLKKGDVLFYNNSFFKPSPLDKTKVDYTFGATAYVAFREANYTIEDSCAISEEFSKRLNTRVTKVRSRVVEFDQEISNALKVGDKVDLDTPLFRIEDAFTRDMSEDDLAVALRHFSASLPTANVVGVINRVEVFYNGQPEMMSESIRKLTNLSERMRKEEAIDSGKPHHPNVVSRYVRIDGTQIESGQCLVVYHIAIELGMGVSDKLVFSSQLKSTVGKVLFGQNRTLDGEPLDAIFGALSGINRTVTSVYKTGGVNTYLRYVGEKAYEMFTSKP